MLNRVLVGSRPKRPRRDGLRVAHGLGQSEYKRVRPRAAKPRRAEGDSVVAKPQGAHQLTRELENGNSCLVSVNHMKMTTRQRNSCGRFELAGSLATPSPASLQGAVGKIEEMNSRIAADKDGQQGIVGADRCDLAPEVVIAVQAEAEIAIHAGRLCKSGGRGREGGCKGSYATTSVIHPVRLSASSPPGQPSPLTHGEWPPPSSRVNDAPVPGHLRCPPPTRYCG